MLREFKKYIEENKLIGPAEKILLAVSGGIDSMVMLHLFIRSGIKAGIAHCNFSLRAGESDMDEELVKQFASDEHLQFHSIRFDTETFAKKHRLSIQMAARQLRYEWFEEIMDKYGYDKTAVAHNLNDNIETLIINLVRGTGISGLTGMKPISNRIIRPLLFSTRQDIVRYCNKHRIIYREDMSNADTKYIRNKIRHQIIPVLKEINPSIEATLNETAERFTGLNEIVTDYLTCLREMVAEQKNDIIKFNIILLKPYLHNKTLLYELFKSFDVNNDQLNDLLKVIEGKTGGQILTGTHRIIKNRKEIIVTDEKKVDYSSYNVGIIEEFANVPGIESAEYINVTDSFEMPSDPLIACLSAWDEK